MTEPIQTNIVSPIHHAVAQVTRYARGRSSGPNEVLSLAALVAETLPPGGTADDVFAAAGGIGQSAYRQHDGAGDLSLFVHRLLNHVGEHDAMAVALLAALVNARHDGRDTDAVSLHVQRLGRFEGGLLCRSRLQIARQSGCRLQSVDSELRRRGVDPAVLPRLPAAELRLAVARRHSTRQTAAELGLSPRDVCSAVKELGLRGVPA